MEEEIKKIEELNNLLTGEAKEIYSQSLENLLAGYKELEEENKQLEAIKDEAIRRYNFESIPKSKVKEKIEELDKTIEEVEENIENTTDEEKRYWKKEKHDLCMQKYILQNLLGKE